MVRKLIVKVLASAFALWVADAALAGFMVSDGIRGYLIAGLALGVLNTFVRPLLKLLSMPLILLTLGLFTVVINAAMLWFVAEALDAVAFTGGLLTLLGATLIVSAVQMVFDRTS